MRQARWLVVVLGWGCLASLAQAQFFTTGFSYRSIAIYGPPLYSPVPYYYGPAYFWPGAYLPPPLSISPRTQVTVNYFSPPVAGAPQKSDSEKLDEEINQLMKRQAKQFPGLALLVDEAPEKPVKGAPTSVYRPVGAKNRAEAKKPVLGEAPLVAPKPADKAPQLPRALGPLNDPLAEHRRQLALGEEALLTLEFGRASQRFRQAIALAPEQPFAYFLLAQAQFGFGKYRDAVDSISSGVRLRPDWPLERFSARARYAAQPELFSEHLRLLQEALERRPNDPGLLFLLAYQWWFDGRFAEAVPLFQRAARVTPDPSIIERFLRVRPS